MANYIEKRIALLNECIEKMKALCGDYDGICDCEGTCSECFINEAIQTLRLRVPKKPLEDTKCPYCKLGLDSSVCGGTKDYISYCPHCGQAIYWEETV